MNVVTDGYVAMCGSETDWWWCNPTRVLAFAQSEEELAEWLEKQGWEKGVRDGEIQKNFWVKEVEGDEDKYFWATIWWVQNDLDGEV